MDECRNNFCPNFFRHPLLDFWNYLPIDEVKLVISKNQTDVVTMIFNGRNTTIESWFSRKNLKSSPWNDLASATGLEFSIKGFELWISRLHGHIHPPEAAELTQHMIPIDTIDAVNVHLIQLTTTGLLRLTLKHFPLMLGPRMSQFPFTCPAAMAVQLLTFTIILAVAFAQEFHDAYYERLPPGYPYGYLQTNPSEKFYKRESLLECTGIALQSQSEFFTYNDVSRVKLVISKNQTDVVTMIFNGRNTTIESWFSRKNLKSSPWNDLASATGLEFSIKGFGLWISRLHGHIHPPEAAELTQHMIPIDTIDVVNVHLIQLTTTDVEILLGTPAGYRKVNTFLGSSVASVDSTDNSGQWLTFSNTVVSVISNKGFYLFQGFSPLLSNISSSSEIPSDAFSPYI
ncbi:Hypothetical predicted protein [Octopus vulgaris]|uniref:Uncharacterized protein n=1 Tax=Octopus vulgaris TaxID=6645 RepID=A0AA36BXV0_OCTVU|nr:Hypothetical predicted protein [Octopus vulgaris]